MTQQAGTPIDRGQEPLPFGDHDRGVITRNQLRDRAEEIARIDQRPPEKATVRDYEQAWNDLTGTPPPDALVGELNETALWTRNPADPQAPEGSQAPKAEAQDEALLNEKEVKRGVGEAVHDEMLKSRDEQ